MTEKIIVAIISLSGVILAAIVSYIVSRTHTKNQIESLRHAYINKLYEKRLEIYPKLYFIFSSFGKVIRYKEVSEEAYINFVRNYEEWNSNNSIYLSPMTLKLFIPFNRTIRRMPKCNAQILWDRDDPDKVTLYIL